MCCSFQMKIDFVRFFDLMVTRRIETTVFSTIRLALLFTLLFITKCSIASLALETRLYFVQNFMYSAFMLLSAFKIYDTCAYAVYFSHKLKCFVCMLLSVFKTYATLMPLPSISHETTEASH